MTTASTGTGSPLGGPANGIRAASAAFESLLTSPEDNQETEEANGAEQPASQEPEEPVAQEASEEAAEESTEESEESATDESEAEPAAEQPQTFTVLVDGKEEKVPLDELLQGYSRTSDYTRKTQALAEQRKQHEGELEQVRAERAEYGALLPKLRAALEAGMGPEPDWSALRREDPVRAAVLWQQREEQRRSLEAVRQDEARVKAQLEAEEAEAAEARSQQEHNRLLEKLPSWRDDKVAASEAALIRKMMIATGFSEDEVAISDHRHVVIALKAAKYDEMMAKKPQLEQKRASAPVVKPGVPVKGVDPHKQAMSKLRKSGSVRDAAAAFANLL